MKETTLAIKWSKREKDLMIHYPRSCDGSLIMHHICNDVLRFDFHKWHDDKFKNTLSPPYEVFNLKQELEKRGYDITTLKFSIELKKDTVK